MRPFHVACKYTSLPICHCDLRGFDGDCDLNEFQCEALLARAAFAKSCYGFMPQEMADPDRREAVFYNYGLIMDSCQEREDPEPDLEPKNVEERSSAEESIARLQKHLEEEQSSGQTVEQPQPEIARSNEGRVTRSRQSRAGARGLFSLTPAE